MRNSDSNWWTVNSNFNFISFLTEKSRIGALIQSLKSSAARAKSLEGFGEIGRRTSSQVSHYLIKNGISVLPQ